MPASSSIISMFHRRLVLLLVLMCAAVVVLATQLGRLTLAKGAELKKVAEAKLVTRQWTPTLRGRILDRQGRVLAQDRPSFDITVDYRVLSGEWAAEKAGILARKIHRAEWKQLSSEERKEFIEQCRVPYDAHVDAMWNRFADTARLNRLDVDSRRESITKYVQRMYEWNRIAGITKGLEASIEIGQAITEDIEEDILKRADIRIEPQNAPHIVLPKVDDAIGFAFQRFVGVQAEIELPPHLFPSGVALPNPLEPLMPGLAVVNAGDREYPMDSMTVDLDLGSLPGPMKKPGQRAKITVEGVGYHILGRVETNAHEDGTVKKDGKVQRVISHATRRERRLEPTDKSNTAHADETFARRVLAPADLLPESMRDLGKYEFNDDSGFSGIEESREDVLRGLRGASVVQLETGQKSTIAPVAGQDVRLTIDIALQARIQAAMSPEFGLAVAQTWHSHENPTVPPGTHLNGAAVVLDVESGDILALVSTPSISRTQVRNNPRAIFDDPLNLAVDLPWLDRAIARPYPPGSIAKALILNGAVMLGKYSLDDPIDCTGHLFPNRPNEFRCWIYKDPSRQTTHNAILGHALSPSEGLMVSCNIFFFTLGQRLGPDGVRDTYTMFGVAQPWNLGVGLEYEGELGIRDKYGKRLAISTQDAIQMGIGQGPVSWTPLHAADAYATIARGGLRKTPHIVNEPSSHETNDLSLDPRAVKEALEGLSMSVNNDSLGTGNHVDIPTGVGDAKERVYNFKDLPNIKVWGKTGTAQAPTIFTQATKKDSRSETEVVDPLFEQSIEVGPIREAARDPKLEFPPGRRALRWGDHSWFVVLVGHQDDNRPLYAIAVMMEYAGSGGKVSGPIITQIIRALMTEGYL